MRRDHSESQSEQTANGTLLDRPPSGVVTSSVLALSVLVAIAIRMHRLREQILGGDELHVLNVLASTPYHAIPRTVGEYDFSIPLALLYGALARWFPLDEIVVRAPMVLFGAVLPLAGFFAFRPLVGGWLALASAWICAIHPFTVFYGRFARPYGIVLVLELIAFGLLVRALDRDAKRPWRMVVAAAICSALAIWSNVPALFASAGLGLAMLWVALSDRAVAKRAGYAVAFGVLTLGLATALYAPALVGLATQLSGNKAGKGLLTVEAVLRATRVLAGSPHSFVAISLALAAVFGTVSMLRARDRALAWLSVPIVVIVAAVVVTRPQLLEFDLVLARYSFVALPFLFMLAIRGWVSLAASMRSPRAEGIALVAILLIYTGCAAASLRALYGVERGYAHHGDFQTYDFLTVEPPPKQASAVYASLADAPLILEWPPPTGFDQNFLHLAQEVHRRPIGLLITDERPFSAPFLALRNGVRVTDVEAGRLASGTAIVLHRNPQFEALSLRNDRTPRQVTTRNPQGFARLVERLKRSLGEPRAQDAFDVAFVVP